MPESMDAEVTRRVVTSSDEVDRSTKWLLWAVAAVLLMLAALLAYALLSGSLSQSVPRTAQEDVLASTAAAIAKDPTDGKQYAMRAEALYSIGDKREAFEVLEQGIKAVDGQNPALLYILRAKTALLNDEGRFADAEKVGKLAMTASDDYLGTQGAKLASKGVTGISGNMKMAASIDTAIQVAETFMGLKKYNKAIEMYNYALRLEPTAGDILALRGWAFLEAGQKAKAKADFEATLKYLPDDPAATSGMKELSK